MQKFDLKTASEILQEFWGYSAFRPDQQAVVRLISQNQNVLAVMATGAGKSVCFQVPAIMIKGFTWVVSPLLSLMKDQTESLKARGIPAIRITSETEKSTHLPQLQGFVSEYDFGLIYCAPEKLHSREIVAFWEKHSPGYVVIDEAHCISQWGHDFRPDYFRIGEALKKIRHGPILAFTATASAGVRREIRMALDPTSEWASYIGNFARSNIALNVYFEKHKRDRFNNLVQTSTVPMIIFTRSRQKTEMLAKRINQSHRKESLAYHAGLSNDERVYIQDLFLSGRCSILVATSAFGMGIDKADIRTVIHADIPESVDAFFQEIGRAGRDGNKSVHHLLVTEDDFIRQRKHLTKKFAAREIIPDMWPSEDQVIDTRQLSNHFSMAQIKVIYEHWWVKGFVSIQDNRDHWIVKSTGTGTFDEAYETIEVYLQHFTDKIAYLENYIYCQDCRMAYLANYFHKEAVHCKICDICINPEQQNIQISKKDSGILRDVASVDGQLSEKKLQAYLQRNSNSEIIFGVPIRWTHNSDILTKIRQLEKDNYIVKSRQNGFKISLTRAGRLALKNSTLKTGI
jgi:RecQ family ATP-dependent DNA helicase